VRRRGEIERGIFAELFLRRRLVHEFS
jgi:hypothetical protein